MQVCGSATHAVWLQALPLACAALCAQKPNRTPAHPGLFIPRAPQHTVYCSTAQLLAAAAASAPPTHRLTKPRPYPPATPLHLQ